METLEKIKEGILITLGGIFFSALLIVFIGGHVLQPRYDEDTHTKNGHHCYNGWYFDHTTRKCVR